MIPIRVRRTTEEGGGGGSLRAPRNRGIRYRMFSDWHIRALRVSAPAIVEYASARLVFFFNRPRGRDSFDRTKVRILTPPVTSECVGYHMRALCVHTAVRENPFDTMPSPFIRFPVAWADRCCV